MSGHIPKRMCVGCRQMRPKSDLIKVCASEDEVRIDIKHKLPGRGAYFCKNAECIEKAKKKKALSRQFKRQVPENIYENVGELLDG